MKILHVIFTLKTGGLENLLLDIANEQANLGHEVGVLIVNSGSEPELLKRFDSRVRIMQTSRKAGSRNPFPIIRANFAAISFHPDIIHVHNENGVNILIPPLRKKVIHTVHTTGINLRGCQASTPVAAISEAVAEDLMSRCQVKSTVIMNGVKVGDISHRSYSDYLVKLVCVGRMDVAVKGQDLLIKALKEFPEMTLTLIGDGADLSAMKDLSVELGVDSRVEFLGALQRSEIYSRLADFDAFVLPSRQEGFGLVVAEAMAAGLPIISVDLPGPMEIIAGGRLGYSFAAGSVESLVEAIKALRDEWPAAQKRALTEGIDFVNANFSVASTVTNYLKLYQSHRAVNK
ncbi:MAG: glycosyltransferase family 4 protein [Muribaculaceae bacterium]|nr:glycosyltransferase family 4 protein [Muribaculaceae bacterium]